MLTSVELMANSQIAKYVAGELIFQSRWIAFHILDTLTADSLSASIIPAIISVNNLHKWTVIKGKN